MTPIRDRGPVGRWLNRRLLPLHQASQRRLHDLNYLFFELTQRCNLACRHCGSDCTADAATPDLPPEKVVEVLGAVRRRYDPSRITVALTGYVMALAYRAWSLTASDQMLDDTEDARLHDRVDEQGEESSVDTITEPEADDDVPPAHDGDAGIRTGSSAAPTQAEGRS